MTATPRAASSARRVVVGVAGADGIEYAVALLERLEAVGAEIHLVLSPVAEEALGTDLGRIRALPEYRYDHQNQAARIASGSFLTRGMVVAPCDAETLRAVVRGLASNLVLRAADVTLKERRRLVIGLPRSTVPSPDDAARLSGLPGAVVVPLEGGVDEDAEALVDQLLAAASP